MPKDKETQAIRKLLGQWSKTEAKTGGLVPDGNYEAKVKTAEAIVKDGKLKAHWVMKVLEGRYEGKPVHKWNTIVTPENLEYLKGDFETMDIEMPDDTTTVKALNALMQETVDLAVEIRVVTNEKEYTNVYFQQLLDGAGDSDDDDADDDAEEDDDEAEADEDEDAEDADDDDEDGDEAPEFSVGDSVSFAKGKKTLTGKIKKLKDDVATVKVGKKLHKIDTEDLAEADED